MEEQVEKYFQDELSPEEKVELLRQTETDELLKKEFIRYQNLHALVNMAPLPQDRKDTTTKYKNFISQNRKKDTIRLGIKAIRNIAAILILMIGTSWFTTFYLTRNDNTLNTLYVPAGQRSCITLSDGTKVWVNANSTFSYPAKFSGKERQVKLTGEAFFEVEKDLSHPFIVYTDDIEIKVLGTKFNIESYPETDYITTSLLEGAVKVYEHGKEATGIILKPNERLHYQNGKMSVSEMKSHEDLLWINGVYSFENESFSQIIKKLELYYDIHIEVTDPQILDFEYTAKFRQRDGVDEILRQIQKAQKFTITKDQEMNKITLSL